MRTIYLVDPHVADFYFIPFFWKLFGKKSLLKYKYFQSLFNSENVRVKIIITKKHSSLPNRIFHQIPFFFREQLLRLEIFFWIRINKLQSAEVIFDNVWNAYGEQSSVFYAFGYKIFDTLLLLSERFHRKSFFYIHLSHYHTFPEVYDLEGKSNIFLCADNDCSETDYFRRKFRNYINPIVIIPFYVRDEFFQDEVKMERMDKVLITGTYHNIGVNQASLDFGIYNLEGNLCLHPDRFRALSLKSNSFVEFRVSEYGKKVNKQKDYFKVPFSDLYRMFRFAYVPGEGTGLIAIGTLEAYCSGCKVFVLKAELKGLGCPKGNLISIDDFYQFENYLENLDSYLMLDNQDVIWADKFRYDNLSNRIMRLFVENIFEADYI